MAGRITAPQTIRLAAGENPSPYLLLHAVEIAERLGVSRERTVEAIRAGALEGRQLRDAWYVAETDFAAAVLSGRLGAFLDSRLDEAEAAFPGAGKRNRSTPPPIARHTRPQGVTRPTAKPPPSSPASPVVPDWSTTVEPFVPAGTTQYAPPDPRYLPALPGNWERVLEADPDTRLVTYVRARWLEGKNSAESAAAVGNSEGKCRTLKKRALELLGI